MKSLAGYSFPVLVIFSIISFVAWFNLGGFDKAPLFAAPYTGEYFNVRQPDDSYVEVRVWGDEYYQRIESPDGYTLIRDATRQGWICYAYLAADSSEFVSTGIVYTGESLEESLLYPPAGVSPDPSFTPATLAKHLDLPGEVISEKAENVRKIFMNELDIPSTSLEQGDSRLRRFRKLSGSVIGLTLLIDFPDVQSSITREEILNFLNQTGYENYGCNGSVRDYFHDISGGQIEYTNHVTDFYTAKHPKAYYTDSSIPIGERARELMHEALDHLDSTGFDFSDLSTDSLNRILALNVFYAGHVDNAWAQGLWPHQGYYPHFEADGVRSRYYQITNIGTDLNLRTFCHENGHMLFDWPDLYDYGQDSTGIGNYCLMAFGGDNDNPVPPCACLRYAAGWEQAIEINYTPPNSNLIHIANSLTTYRYTNPGNSQEAFFIESRIREGRNAHIPAEGMIIWHMDLLGNNDHEQMTCEKHYKISLEQADGLYDLEFRRNLGDEEDLFREGDEFGSDTIPDSDWWCKGQSGLNISDIHRIDKETHFTLVGSSLEFKDQVIDSGVYTANLIIAGPHVTIARGSQVTLVATNSITAFTNFTIEEDSNVVFEAPLIRVSHDFIVKSGCKVTLKASDSIIIGPDFFIEDDAEIDIQAKRVIQFWPTISVQKDGRLKAAMIHDGTGPDPNAPGTSNGEGSNGNGQEYQDVSITGFLDADGDGYGDPNICVQGYNIQSGFVLNKIDCNDGDPQKNPREMTIRTVKGRILEDFEYGRNLISTLEPSCNPYTTFDLLSDYKELGSTLNLQYQDPSSDFFHPTYWFFGKVCGSNREVPPIEKDDLRVIDFVVDKVQ